MLEDATMSTNEQDNGWLTEEQGNEWYCKDYDDFVPLGKRCPLCNASEEDTAGDFYHNDDIIELSDDDVFTEVTKDHIIGDVIDPEDNIDDLGF